MPSASTTGSLWKRRNDSPKCPSHGQNSTAGVQANEVLSVLFTAESKHCYSQDTAQCTLDPVSRTGPLELYLKMSQPWTCLLGTLREEMRPQRAVLSNMVSFISISSGFLQENYSRDKRRRNLGGLGLLLWGPGQRRSHRIGSQASSRLLSLDPSTAALKMGGAWLSTANQTDNLTASTSSPQPILDGDF